MQVFAPVLRICITCTWQLCKDHHAIDYGQAALILSYRFCLLQSYSAVIINNLRNLFDLSCAACHPKVSCNPTVHMSSDWSKGLQWQHWHVRILLYTRKASLPVMPGKIACFRSLNQMILSILTMLWNTVQLSHAIWLIFVTKFCYENGSFSHSLYIWGRKSGTMQKFAWLASAMFFGHRDQY